MEGGKVPRLTDQELSLVVEKIEGEGENASSPNYDNYYTVPAETSAQVQSISRFPSGKSDAQLGSGVEGGKPQSTWKDLATTIFDKKVSQDEIKIHQTDKGGPVSQDGSKKGDGE